MTTYREKCLDIFRADIEKLHEFRSQEKWDKYITYLARWSSGFRRKKKPWHTPEWTEGIRIFVESAESIRESLWIHPHLRRLYANEETMTARVKSLEIVKDGRAFIVGNGQSYLEKHKDFLEKDDREWVQATEFKHIGHYINCFPLCIQFDKIDRLRLIYEGPWQEMVKEFEQDKEDFGRDPEGVGHHVGFGVMCHLLAGAALWAEARNKNDASLAAEAQEEFFHAFYDEFHRSESKTTGINDWTLPLLIDLEFGLSQKDIKEYSQNFKQTAILYKPLREYILENDIKLVPFDPSHLPPAEEIESIFFKNFK